MSKGIFISKEIEDQLKDNMEVLLAIFNPTLPNVGIMILGEDHHPDSNLVILRIYLLSLKNLEWCIRDELQAFSFTSYANASSFLNSVEEMSAIDLMLFMNNHMFQIRQPFLQ